MIQSEDNFIYLWLLSGTIGIIVSIIMFIISIKQKDREMFQIGLGLFVCSVTPFIVAAFIFVTIIAIVGGIIYLGETLTNIIFKK